MRQSLFIALIFTLAVSCTNENRNKKIDTKNLSQLTADEVLQTSQYTYIRSGSGADEQWFAVPSMQVIEGTTYFYENGMEMNNFKSRELDRVFDKITLLVGIYNGNPDSNQQPAGSATGHTAKINTEKVNVDVEVAPDGISIAELMKKKKSYKNKVVKVKGIVTKFNPSIMETNWVHIQDGTEFEEHFDLTITTDQIVKIGDIVTFEGKIALDKDFGYGYVYDVLLEKAQIIE